MEIKTDNSSDTNTSISSVESDLKVFKAVQAERFTWLYIIGALLLAFLGYTNFFSIPGQVKKAVGLDVIEERDQLMQQLRDNHDEAARIVVLMREWGLIDYVEDIGNRLVIVEDSITETTRTIEIVDSRIDGISLKAGTAISDAAVSEIYPDLAGCGIMDFGEEGLWFIYGFNTTRGVDCSVREILGKKLELIIPPRR